MFKKISFTLGAMAVALLAIFVAWNAAGENPFWSRRGELPLSSPTLGSNAEPDTATDQHASLQGARVVLTPEKIAAAQVEVGSVQSTAMQSQRTIAGRLDYDQERHVAVQSACGGIIVAMRVQPGDDVSAGQVVAVISSPEVGEARAEVRSNLAETRLARTKQEWQAAVCSGVEALAEMIRSGRSPQEITSALEDESLGAFREKLVTAYTRSRLAQKLVDNTRIAADSGAIASSVQQQRESELQAASAALDSVMEQSLFEVQQLCRAATADAQQAQRLVDISLQRLSTLLGPAAVPATVEQFAPHRDEASQESGRDAAAGSMLDAADEGQLSHVDLLAPIAGTVEERNLSTGERVVAGQTLYTVADVSHLWAVADVRERDWEAISVAIGEKVSVSSPAIADQNYWGEVIIVGRRVDPATGAAPLIARMEAYDPRLRPGLFIRMTVPTSQPRQVLTVPEPAVVVHEGIHFVFLAESPSTFERRDVQIGASQSGRTEIVSGLSAGDSVVTSGAFQLKSELLLAGEEE